MKCSLRLLLLAGFLTLIRISSAFGDGGAVQFQQEAGPFLITLLTSPTPLRAGMVDFSVLVQSHEIRDPVLDAVVRLSLHNREGTSIEGEATRQQAQNKLLYAVVLPVEKSGSWDVEISVSRGSDAVRTSGEIAILPPRSPLASYWVYLLIPPVVVILFIMNQRLKKRV